jgi:hypothetical protein
MAERSKASLPKAHDSMATQPAPDSFPLDNPPEAVEPETAVPAEPPVPEPRREPIPPKDVVGVKTIMADEATDAPHRIRVWEGQHSADAVILKVNEDATLDLSADLWGNEQPVTLFGVKRRVGSGNGYEEIDPVAEQRTKAALPHDTNDDSAAGQAPQNMVTLRSEVAFNGELQLGHSSYEVKDGVVIVPPWHVDAARAAGYR